MAKAIDSSKQILAGLLIFSFLLIILIATRSMKTDDKKESKKTKEGFKVAPTRAAECKCLPGYVPSNVRNSKYGGVFLWVKPGVYFKPDNEDVYYWVPNCYMCNINICSMLVETTQKELDKYKQKETFTCEIMKQYIEKNKNGIYFCQSLADPSDTKQCY